VEQTLQGIEERITGLNRSSGTGSLRTTKIHLYQIERLAIRWLALGRRMGLPDDAGRAIDLLARLTVTIRMLHIASNLLMSSNPVFVALGGAGAIGSILQMIDSAEGFA